MALKVGVKVIRTSLGGGKGTKGVIESYSGKNDGKLWNIYLPATGKSTVWSVHSFKVDEVPDYFPEPKFKNGDTVIRTSLGGKGQKAVLLSNVNSTIWKVKKVANGITQHWHELHFKKDDIPEYKPVDKDFGRKVGDVVVHTAFEAKPARIVGEDAVDDEYWRLTGVESGNPHRWKKAYCVLEGTKAVPPKPILGDYYTVKGWKTDMANWDKKYNPCAEIPISGRPADTVVIDDIEDANRYALRVLEQMVNPPLLVGRETYKDDVWLKEYFNTPSEEDTMKLLVEDFTTINGVKSDAINTDGYIKLISDAEGEIERLETLQQNSKAIAQSSTITNAIKELKAGVERCVAFMDKADK